MQIKYDQKIKPEERERSKEEIEAAKYCMEWSKARKWLQHHGVKYDNFPEELEFDRLIFKHHFAE